MQGAEPAPGLNLALSVAGGGERLVSEHGDKRVQRGVERFNLLEAFADYVHRRQRTGADLLAGIGEGWQ